MAILRSQNNVCAICKKVPSTGRFVTDHDHVKGFKKMPDDQKREYIRGLTCWFCNLHFLGRGITIDKAKNVVRYLEDYKNR